MRDIGLIVKEIAEIYRRSGDQAEEYLQKARKLKKMFGPGLAIVYCWFYSVPQKWSQVEPKIFELMSLTNSFDLDTMLEISKEQLAAMLKPMIFYNEIALQLKNFCGAVKGGYESWEFFAEVIKERDILSVFENLRKHGGIRLTFKNLAAMKSFVGLSNDFLILDTHVAKVLGINKDVRNKYRVQEKLFKDLLIFSDRITQALEREGFQRMTTIRWSLAIWFNKTGVQADELLTNI